MSGTSFFNYYGNTPVIRTTDGGEKWTNVTHGTPGLAGIVCLSTKTCEGVANNDLYSTSNAAKTWTTEQIVIAPTEDVGLQSIACPAAGECVAGGEVGKGNSEYGITGQTADGTWAVQSTPKKLPQVSSVACTGVNECVADGFTSILQRT